MLGHTGCQYLVVSGIISLLSCVSVQVNDPTASISCNASAYWLCVSGSSPTAWPAR